jgi:hypothetical protein
MGTRYDRTMDHEKLQRRLQHVRQLAEAGATAGERGAARAAAARLEARIAETAPPRVAPVQLDPALRPGPASLVPTAATLRAAIEAWSSGDRSPHGIAVEARRLIDRVVLPDRPPTDPLSIRVEVVMLLSTLDRGPLSPLDGPALLRFLDGCAHDPAAAWRAWFRHLEGQAPPTFEAC